MGKPTGFLEVTRETPKKDQSLNVLAITKK
jgi:hypothetical protein